MTNLTTSPTVANPDPRGPERTIMSGAESSGPTLLALSCGHVREFTNHFHYKVGDHVRCFACRQSAS